MGLKLRIHPLAATIALDQLTHLDAYLDARTEMAEVMCEELGKLSGIIAPTLPQGVHASWYGLPLITSRKNSTACPSSDSTRPSSRKGATRPTALAPPVRSTYFPCSRTLDHSCRLPR